MQNRGKGDIPKTHLDGRACVAYTGQEGCFMSKMITIVAFSQSNEQLVSMTLLMTVLLCVSHLGAVLFLGHHAGMCEMV